jgi:hypothetical protein
MTAANVTASYDLVVYVRRSFELDAAQLTRALRELGLDATLPAGARLATANVDYFPVRVTLGDEELRTGFSLAAPREVDRLEGYAPSDIVPGAVADYVLYAKNAPAPTDENEVPMALYVAAALARLGQGAVVDPQQTGEPVEHEELDSVLRHALEQFEPGRSGWERYPYELLVAAEEGDLESVARELDAGEPIDGRDNHGNTPLLLALTYRHVPLARLLLERDADVRAQNRYGKSALDAALTLGELALVRGLIERGAPCDREALSAASLGHGERLELLLDAGCPLEVTTPGGWTPLMLAIYEGHVELARRLVERGAELERENRDGATALMVAADQGHAELVRMFVDRGADSTHRAKDGATALRWARARGHEAVVELLRGPSSSRRGA